MSGRIRVGAVAVVALVAVVAVGVGSLFAGGDPTGVAVGLPRVSASERTITAPFVPELRLGLAADAFTATRADPVSVTSTYTSSGTPVGELDLAEGWPYVGYTALQDQEATVPAGLDHRDGGRWLAMGAGDTTYGLAVAGSDGSRRVIESSGGVVRLDRGETLLAFAARRDRTLAHLARGAVPVHGTSTSYDISGGTGPDQDHLRDSPRPEHRAGGDAAPAPGSRVSARLLVAEPSAMLGIQLLPMPPVLVQRQVDVRVRASVSEASADGFDTMFGDYVAMYLAVAEPRRALKIGRELPASAIDDGNTRNYLLAWLLAARAGHHVAHN